jgi:hypothetical protein
VGIDDLVSPTGHSGLGYLRGQGWTCGDTGLLAVARYGRAVGFGDGVASLGLGPVGLIGAGRPERGVRLAVSVFAQVGQPVVHLGPFAGPGRAGIFRPEFDLHTRASRSVGRASCRWWARASPGGLASFRVGHGFFSLLESFTVLNLNNRAIKFR